MSFLDTVADLTTSHITPIEDQETTLYLGTTTTFLFRSSDNFV